MIECPVDISKLQPGTMALLDAPEAATELAVSLYCDEHERVVDRVTYSCLPVEATVRAKDSDIPLAVFYTYPDYEGDTGFVSIFTTLLEVNEDELYREGRATELVTSVREVESRPTISAA